MKYILFAEENTAKNGKDDRKIAAKKVSQKIWQVIMTRRNHSGEKFFFIYLGQAGLDSLAQEGLLDAVVGGAGGGGGGGSGGSGGCGGGGNLPLLPEHDKKLWQ